MNYLKIFLFFLALSIVIALLYYILMKMPEESAKTGSRIIGMFHP